MKSDLSSVKNNGLNFKLIALVSALVLVVGGVVGAFSMYNFYNNTRNMSIQKESNLTSIYNQNKAELASASMQISETLGIADKASDKVNSIWADAISGRYGEGMDGKGEGTLINALSIAEQNPDVKGLVENYSKVQDVVVSARTAFKNKQNKLQDTAAEYETFLKSGVFRSQFVKMQGFPSEDLKVEMNNGTTLRGRDALDKMKNVIVDSGTNKSFDTGILESPITSN